MGRGEIGFRGVEGSWGVLEGDEEVGRGERGCRGEELSWGVFEGRGENEEAEGRGEALGGTGRGGRKVLGRGG